MQITENILAARGFTRVSNPAEADLAVGFTLGGREKIQVNSYPEFYRGDYGGWGWGGGYYGGYIRPSGTSANLAWQGNRANNKEDAREPGASTGEHFLRLPLRATSQSSRFPRQPSLDNRLCWAQKDFCKSCLYGFRRHSGAWELTYAFVVFVKVFSRNRHFHTAVSQLIAG